MQLLFVSNVRIPSERAAGIQIMKMCEAFAREGIDVILALPWRFGRIEEDPFVYYGVERSFRIVRLPALDLIPLERLLGRFAFWARTVTFRFSLWLYRLLHRVDIVYSREWFLAPRDSVLELHKFPSRVTHWHRASWGRTRKIVVITEGLKDDLLNEGVESNKILVAPDAVDSNAFNVGVTKQQAREKLSLPQEKNIILYTGGLLSWKGVDVLLEAANEAQNGERTDQKELLFVVVGGREDQIADIQEVHGHSANAVFVGRRSHTEIPLWLAAADVLVLPNKKGVSISERHTSPLKLFEYMASGRPIVASDLPSLREVIGDDTALLVKPNDPAALLAGIDRVLNSVEVARDRAVRAQSTVKQMTWRARAKRIIREIV